MKCIKCDGCGKVADTEDREPWTEWTALPLQSSVAVLIGIVKPIQCLECLGMGEVIIDEK